MSSADLVPSEWFGIGIVSFDERGDVRPKGGDTAIDAAPDLLIGKEREEAFDLIDELVGVRCTCQRGLLASRFRISGVLCVA